MEVARFRQIEDVLQAALSRPSGERDAFVVSACGENESLRQDVPGNSSRSRKASRPRWSINSVSLLPLLIGGASRDGRR
jgi:hypothetical protein